MQERLTLTCATLQIAVAIHTNLRAMTRVELAPTVDLPLVDGDTPATVKVAVPLKPAERIVRRDEVSINPPLTRLAGALAEVVGSGYVPVWYQWHVIEVAAAKDAELEQLSRRAIRLKLLIIIEVWTLEVGELINPHSTKLSAIASASFVSASRSALSGCLLMSIFAI